MKRNLRVVGLALGLTLAGTGGRAAAQIGSAAEPAEVERLIREANNLRRDKRDAMALPLLQKAYDLAPNPRTEAQLGLVQVNLGYFLAAEEHLSNALAARQHYWVLENRKMLEAGLAQARAAIGEVTISGTPAGSDVVINGRAAGKLPLAAPIRLGEGRARLQVKADGHVPFERNLVIDGGSKQTVVVTLVPSASPEPVAAAEPETPSPQSTATLAQPMATVASGDRGPSVPAYVTGGVALAVGGLAAWQTVRWLDAKDKFESYSPTGDPRNLPCGTDEDNRGPGDCGNLYKDMKRQSLLAIGSYAVAGALAVTSIVLFVRSSGSTDAPSESARAGGINLACAPTLGSPGGICRLAF